MGAKRRKVTNTKCPGGTGALSIESEDIVSMRSMGIQRDFISRVSRASPAHIEVANQSRNERVVAIAISLQKFTRNCISIT